jgi:hypothetical protein
MRYLLDIPEYNVRAFKPMGQRLTTLYGKSDPPPPPDYRAAAQETAQGNLEMARLSTTANRPNQITPYGTSTWAQGPATRTFNQGAYDKAVEAAQAGMVQQAAQPGQGGAYGGTWGDSQGGVGGMTQSATAGSYAMPDRNDESFWTSSPSDQWTQTVSLAPEAQQVVDKQIGLSNRYADLATTGLDKASKTLEDPMLDMSQIPRRAINPGQTAQEAIMARLQPQFAQQEEALRTRLANQGVTPGSEAFGNDFRNFSAKRNDAEIQAALYGLGLDDANRKSALQEQSFIQDRPLNLINALRTGAQVTNPQFQNFSQQATTAGPDLLGATKAKGDWDLANYNAEQAQNGSMMSGLFSLGSAAFGFPGMGPGIFGR